MLKPRRSTPALSLTLTGLLALALSLASGCDPGPVAGEEVSRESATVFRVAYEGTCEFLRTASSWSCGDVPLFTCDRECRHARVYGCDDADHWMAVPAAVFSYAACGQCYEVCTGGVCTFGYLRDKSCCGAYEVSTAIARVLGTGVSSFDGTVQAVDQSRCAYLEIFSQDPLGIYPLAQGGAVAAASDPSVSTPPTSSLPPANAGSPPAAVRCVGSDSAGVPRNTDIIGSKVCGAVDTGDTVNRIWECTAAGWSKTTQTCSPACRCAGGQEQGQPGVTFTLSGCGGRVCSLTGQWVQCLLSGWDEPDGSCSR